MAFKKKPDPFVRTALWLKAAVWLTALALLLFITFRLIWLMHR